MIIIKNISHDENGFPLNYNPSSYYKQNELMFNFPEYMNIDKRYLITTWGRIYNTITGKFIPQKLILETNRYQKVVIKDIYGNDIYFKMHQLMANIFIMGKPIYYCVVNHIDGVKWHNELYNLEWVTLSENTIHADQNNLIARPYGEDNGQSALTDDQYNLICKLTHEGYFPAQINKIMNLPIDITNICQKIRSGKSETLISKSYDFTNIPRNDYRKFSEEQVRSICYYLQNYPKMSPRDILIKIGYNVDKISFEELKKYRDTISTIKRKVSYKEIVKNYIF